MINDIYLKIDSETNPDNFNICWDNDECLIYVDYCGIRLLTIFMAAEIHVESVIPVDTSILFSNSMSYSISKVFECQDNCITVINTLDDYLNKFKELVEECSNEFDVISTNCSCKVNLCYGGYLKFGLREDGFYCDVYLKSNNLTLTPAELDLALNVGKAFNVNPNIVKVEESLPKSDVFKIE